MNNKNLFKKLVSEEVKKILKEAAAFEADPEAVFGKYLWADPGDSANNRSWGYREKYKKRIRKDKAKEKNTEEENEFLYSFLDYVSDPMSTEKLESIIANILRPAKANGQYAKYINPPNVPVYRGIIVNQKTAARILRLPIKEIREDAEKAWYVSGGGRLPPLGGQKIMSWTTDPRVAMRFATNNEGDHVESSDDIAIILVANTQTGGDFYLNPGAINKKFNFSKVENLVTEESEVISYGPVSFTEASFIAKNNQGNKEIVKQVGKITNEFLVNELSDFTPGEFKSRDMLKVMDKSMLKKIQNIFPASNGHVAAYFVNNLFYTIKRMLFYGPRYLVNHPLDDSIKLKDTEHYETKTKQILQVVLEDLLEFLDDEAQNAFSDIPNVNKILLNALALKHKKKK